MARRRYNVEAATTSKPPTSEQGSASGIGGLTWGALAGGDDFERVPELQWPSSVTAYRLMLNDAQVNSLMLGLLFPIRAYRWYLKPNGARPEVIDRISRNYNLPIDRAVLGQEDEFNRRRAARRFSFEKHMEDALRALTYGHYFFEQLGEITGGEWALRKLGPRPPRTLSEINVAKDGGLESIRQQTGPLTPPIPVNVLVAYVWDREGSDWVGRSMLRPIYKNHLVKDRILRVGAINIERAGGVPYINAPEGASGQEIKELDAIARAFRVGESAGAALPHGAQLKFAMAAGGDGAVNYIKLQNEEMARSFLEMAQTLGQSSSGSGGALALSTNHMDWLGLCQETIAKWFRDIFNEHVIEDDVEWNEGPNEEFAPLLDFETAQAPNPDAGLNAAVGQNDGLQLDPTGQAAAMIGFRRTPSRASAMRQAPAGRRSQVRGAGSNASPVALPARPLRRQPYEHEIRAATDFAQLDSTHQSAVNLLVSEVRTLQQYQIDQLHDQIVEAAGNLDSIMEIEADPQHANVIRDRLMVVAAISIQQAVDEANRQGVEVLRPTAEDLAASLEERANAVDLMLTRDLAQAAARQAARLTGGGLDSAEVAAATRTHLRGLSDAYLRDMLGGATQQAVNAGRKLVFQRDGEQGDVYASELLDSNTCTHCVGIDGTQYDSLATAERDYPTGGFKDCEGRERCRGTLVKVYTSETPATLQAPFSASHKLEAVFDETLHPRDGEGKFTSQLDRALDDWFDFESASAIKAASRGEDMSKFMTTGGDHLTQEEQNAAREAADLIQAAAWGSHVNDKAAYRGEVWPSLAEAKAAYTFKPKELDSLTAVTADKDIAAVYSDKARAGLEDDDKAVSVNVTYYDKNGLEGIERDGNNEIIMPKGVPYKYRYVGQDANGVHIFEATLARKQREEMS